MGDPLPPFYYYFFWLFEPALILSGAYYAIVSPEAYGADLLPEGVERVTVIIGQTTRGQMLTGGLGSCFLLLAMMSLSLFPIIRRHLVHEPHIQEKLVRGMLVPLAIADLTHITLTLLPFPMSLLKSPSRWTTLINGNVWITIGLFLVRMSWLFGIGRHRSLPAHQSTADRAAPSEKTSSPESLVPSGQRNGPESVAPAENPTASPPTSASSTETTRTTRSTRSTRAAPRRGKKAAAAAELEEIGKDASS